MPVIASGFTPNTSGLCCGCMRDKQAETSWRSSNSKPSSRLGCASEPKSEYCPFPHRSPYRTPASSCSRSSWLWQLRRECSFKKIDTSASMPQ